MTLALSEMKPGDIPIHVSTVQRSYMEKFHVKNILCIKFLLRLIFVG